MSDAWVITVLVENSVHRAGLQAERPRALRGNARSKCLAAADVEHDFRRDA